MNAPTRTTPAARAPAAPGAAAEAIGAALLALSRAARSVLLYDAGNAVVGQHVADYRAKMEGVLAASGGFELTVRPFELVVGDVAVYQDPDREKSLAFRLYGDGVRRLRFPAQVPASELLSLLEVVAIRYTGVRQQEEDTVTLLRRAGFRAITFDYVEGFTPSEELPEPPADAAVERAQRRAPPPTWDTPVRALPPPAAAVAYRAVPEAELAAVRAEASGDALAALAVGVTRDLVAVFGGGAAEPDRDLAAFVQEVREALLTNLQLGALRRLHDVLAESDAAVLRQELARALQEPRAVQAVLASVPDGCREPPADVLAVVPLLGLEPLVAEVASASGRRRAILLALVEARLPADADAVVARIAGADAELARDLATAVVRRAPERGIKVARQLLARPEEEMRTAGVEVLGEVPGAIPLRPVVALLDDKAERVRIRAAEVLARRGDAEAIEPLRARLEGGKASPAEAEALGRALASVAPTRVAALLAGWLEPERRFLRGISAAQRTLQWAAVAGIGELPSADADAVLERLAARSDAELRAHCLATLARRRGAGRGR